MSDQSPDVAPILAAECRKLEKAGDLVQLEHLAIEWLAQTPWAVEPHGFLFTCYAKRRDRNLAEALLIHFRKSCPAEHRERERLERAFAKTFTKPIEPVSGPVYTDDAKPAPSRMAALIGRFFPARRALDTSMLA